MNVLRIKGRDKGLVELSGRPLVEWSLEALSRQTRAVDHVLISANRNFVSASAGGQ